MATPMANASALLACISICGSLFIVGTFALIKCSRRMSTPADLGRLVWQRPVLFVAIADIGSAAGKIMGLWQGPDVCLAQAMFSSFFDLASVLWTLILTVQLEVIMIRRMNSAKLEPAYHAFAWGGAALAAILPMAVGGRGMFGHNLLTQSCWLVPGSAWPYAIFYVPVWLGFLVVATVFVRVRRHLRADLAESEEKASVLRKLWAYPLIFVVLWAASTADKVCFDIAGHSPRWLLWLHVVSASLQGFLNAAVFGTVHFGADKVVREWLRRKGICRCCWPRDLAAGQQPQLALPRGRRSTKVLWQATGGGGGGVGYDGGSQPLLA